jgi:cytochrome bd-type quinol oxidase subunit 2
MNLITIDIIGYSALAINLYSMSTKGEYKLRLISAIANFIYIVYGILISAFPIIIGCSIAVVLHIYRLNRLKIRNND